LTHRVRGSPYLDAAADATRWVVASTVPTTGGRAFAGDSPDSVADDLYAGGAGLLALAAEAHLAGVSVPVAEVRDRLVDRCAASDPADDVGLYQGVAGYGSALLVYGSAAADPVALAGADAAVRRLGDSWSPDGWPAPARYTQGEVYLDVISGAAGIALFLVRVGTPAALELAERAGELLLAHAEPTPGGLQWPMRPGHEPHMPNFSHGTAGTATALALVGHACGRPDLLDAAVRGAAHLRSLARPGVGFTVPNAVPPADDVEPVSYGWCHGPTGTVRLYWAIGDLGTVDDGLLAIMGSGIPDRPRPGFWDNLGRCCGSAGVGEVVLDRYQQTGRPDLLAFADLLAADILDRATTDHAGTRWSFTEHRNDVPDLPPEPTWMQGAAGIAAYLYRLHRVHRDGRSAPRLSWPDAPVA
jgi:hypothetical protein